MTACFQDSMTCFRRLPTAFCASVLASFVMRLRCFPAPVAFKIALFTLVLHSVLHKDAKSSCFWAPGFPSSKYLKDRTEDKTVKD